MVLLGSFRIYFCNLLIVLALFRKNLLSSWKLVGSLSDWLLRMEDRILNFKIFGEYLCTLLLYNCQSWTLIRLAWVKLLIFDFCLMGLTERVEQTLQSWCVLRSIVFNIIKVGINSPVWKSGVLSVLYSGLSYSGNVWNSLLLLLEYWQRFGWQLRRKF